MSLGKQNSLAHLEGFIVSWRRRGPQHCLQKSAPTQDFAQNYWIFGLFPSSDIQGTRKHDVSETASVSVLRRVQWLMLAVFKGPNTVGVFPTHLRTETGAVSETSCFLVRRIPDGEKVENPSNSECYTPSSEPFKIFKISRSQPFRYKFNDCWTNCKMA
jgi:hypothetical protein